MLGDRSLPGPAGKLTALLEIHSWILEWKEVGWEGSVRRWRVGKDETGWEGKGAVVSSYTRLLGPS